MGAPLQTTRAPRVTFTGSAIASLGNRQLTCTGGNLSASGMLIFPPERARPGQFVRLLFSLTAAPKWVEADALLVREATERNRYGWGMQFLQLAPHHGAELQRFISERLRELTARQHREGFTDDETPVRELYREALSQVERERGKGKAGK